jgi:cobalamin biosynthesis protein CbiD
MSFPIIGMVVEPKAHRLDIAVPRVFGGIGMAIVASPFHDRGDVFGNLVIFGNVKIVGSRIVFFHGNKLDGY